MNLSNLTVLTTSYNEHLLTKMMIMSLLKKDVLPAEIIIIDNSNKNKITNDLINDFTVIDNFQNKILNNNWISSRQHTAMIDYVFKNNIKTDWCLLVDNDILFKSSIKIFLENFNENECDCCGEIGWDNTPPDRLFPYFCLINIKKFNEQKLSYFDPNRIITNAKLKNWCDTGCSFYNDIKSIWKIKKIKMNDYIVHYKGASLQNKNAITFLSKYKHLL